MDDRVQRESLFSTSGVTDPARRMHLLKVSLPSSSSAPVERVLSVDAVMDVARSILWPEIGSKKPSEGDATRAQAKKPSHCLESGTLDSEEDAR
jgi:hypothetical protein